ncbi:hypothetical protein TNIN_446271 [Trichonephila inaurata madagascariensis]|uniref:Uncharacterized protein n=1 Tax=Trichonephila inaurata madagascariensis TaxID=2747483 RepID=A0A8X6YKM2_9ARAC|nr:hypothetical protein TNIN_446271 [Trichonephila inaurata madagascariensis]
MARLNFTESTKRGHPSASKTKSTHRMVLIILFLADAVKECVVIPTKRDTHCIGNELKSNVGFGSPSLSVNTNAPSLQCWHCAVGKFELLPSEIRASNARCDMTRMFAIGFGGGGWYSVGLTI